MSFNRLNYDTCSYKHALNASVKVGDYHLTTPIQENECFYPNPYIRLDKNGNSICDKDVIDVDSELLGLNVPATKCPTKKYSPSEKPFCNLKHMKDCDFLSPEDTKLSNPACTLRGTGWNRWEWLCENPQNFAIMPFEREIQNRIVVKDNHRPCLPNPLNPEESLPKCDDNCEIPRDWITYQDTSFPHVHWRCCGEIQKY
jgi:hypothetical protein